MNKPFFYIANWKMYFTYNQTISWINLHHEDLSKLAKDHQVIICPSYVGLDYTAKKFSTGHILLGAQDCSEHPQGAHTGQISAESLAQIGCNYCIIGHSEQRQFFKNRAIEQKALRLLEQNIAPIFCVGSADPSELIPAISALEQFPENEILIAYEPQGSIGTGVIPENIEIEAIFFKISTLIKEQSPNHQFYMLYGGSVNKNNAYKLKNINLLDGFLIGGASTRFDELRQIVES